MEFEGVTGINGDLIEKALTAATRARDAELFYELRGHTTVFYGFPESYSAKDWLAPTNTASFGETKINREHFPCLRSIGNDKDASVNEAFLSKLDVLLPSSLFQAHVKQAVDQRKDIVFTGLSSGGATAIAVTVWFLESYLKPDPTISPPPPRCVTFGAPLVGDSVFRHALARENWARYFLHFVTRFDIIPRIMLSPRSTIDQALQLFLDHLNHKSKALASGAEQIIKDLYMTVMRNTSSVSSITACQLMGNTNSIIETFSRFIEISPYRPFGTYIFCLNKNMVAVKNSDVALQILFYSFQLSHQFQSIKDHQSYGMIPELMGARLLYCLDELPLPSAEGGLNTTTNSIDAALNELGLSIKGRQCVKGAMEGENQRIRNQTYIKARKGEIEKKLEWIEREYKAKCKARGIGYYDSFKDSSEEYDFKANVKRAELAGIFDEIIGLLKNYQLPDEFEACKEWINLGTEYRRLVEPLDIANYYRHLKNEDTGPYMGKGRPNRYKFCQRWFEHARWKSTGRNPENVFWDKVKALNLGAIHDIKEEFKLSGLKSGSCFWTEVEELRGKPYQEISMRVRTLETMLCSWIEEGEVDEHIFAEGSTFCKWWTTLPDHHKIQSPVSRFIIMHG